MTRTLLALTRARLRTSLTSRRRPVDKARKARLKFESLEDRLTPGTVSLSSPTYTVDEGAGSVTVSIQYSPDPGDQPFTLMYSVHDDDPVSAHAGDDYGGGPGFVSFGTDPTIAGVQIPIVDDQLAEGPETFVFELSGSPPIWITGVPPTKATITILDNDSGTTAPTVTISPVQNTIEGATGSGVGRFAVTRSGGDTDQELNVLVGYSGLATYGTDYTVGGNASGTTVHFGIGQTTAYIDVTAATDGLVEGSESVVATLQDPGDGSYTVGSPGTATISIQDNDAGATPAVTIHRVRNTVEGATGDQVGRFDVTRSNIGAGDLTVQLSYSGQATYGTDYTVGGDASGLTVRIPAGQTTGTILISAADDGIFENDEDVVATLLAAGDGSYTLGSPAQDSLEIADKLGPKAFVAEDSDCGCGKTPLAGGPAVGQSGAVEVAGSRARYADGVLTAQETDLVTDGLGAVLSLTRGFANGFGYDAAGYDGNNTVDAALPYLRRDAVGVIAAITDGSTARFFDPAGGNYTARNYSKDTFAHDTGADEYTLTTADGTRVTFFGFDAPRPAFESGALKSITDPAGNVIDVAGFTADGKPTALRKTGTVNGSAVVEEFAFTYLSGGANDGKVQSVQVQRQTNGGPWTPVRSAEYAYYDGTTSGGTAGDLKTAVVKDAAGSVIDSDYYRYYTADTTDANGTPVGYAGGLKMSFSSASYARLTAAYPDPDAATDAQAGVYADAQYQFDELHRVTRAVLQGAGCSSCSGGEGTYFYAYQTRTSADPDGYNAWKYKTVETEPDGNTTTVYANYVGQTILSVYRDVTTGQEWATYHQYDSAGRRILTAEPSAVASYSEASPGLATLNPTTGLIETTTYYTATTATEVAAGGAAGYEYQTFLKRGANGTPVLQSTTAYYSHTAGTITVYPVATQTQYRNESPDGGAGSGAQTTTYSYVYFTGSIQPQQVTTTLPAVTTAQNGPNAATSTVTVYDDQGRAIWSKDQDGFITHTVYDNVTGGVSQTIADVNTALTSDEPAGWTTPAGGGLHQVTNYELDDQGRATKVTDPNGHVTYTVYNDAAHEVRTYPGWDAAHNKPTGPTQVSREDRARGYTETLTMSAPPVVDANGRPTGAEAVSGIQSLSRSVVNEAGQTIYEDQYFDLTGITYTQSSVTLGTAGTNYLRTQYSYGKLGQLERTVSPAGTITRTVTDGQNREVSTWVGTDDTPTTGFWSPTNTGGTDLVKVSENVYDDTNGDGDGTDLGDVGDGNLSRTTLFPGGGAANRVTRYAYDWRDRLVATKSGVEGTESTSVNRPITYTQYDNLGEAVASEMYDGDGLSITTDANGDGVPDRPLAGALRAKSTADFDELGRDYQDKTFSVDPTTGGVSTNALTTKTWYNARGLVMKTSSPGGLVSKTEFDGLGRTTKSYVTDGGGDAAYADAGDVTGDVVLTQTELTYDAAGNTILVTTRDRFHDATLTGPLGDPGSPTLAKARVSSSASYYDPADRLTDAVDVGTNGGTAYTRPAGVPARSDTVLVTSYGYNEAGEVEAVTDPRGLVNKTFYDLLGRTTKTVQDYVDGVVSDADDKTVEYTYDAGGHQATLRADLTGGYQETKWVYGVAGPVVSNDLLKEMQYPDPASGNASSTQKDAYTYDQLGDVLTQADRNGNVHTYGYDVLGRPVSDAVTTLGTGVEDNVLRIETAYDGQGNAYLITSYNAAAGGAVVNQVKREYNGLGQLTTEWQAPNGAVTGSSPRVRYTYSEMAGGANHSRLTSVTYPTTTRVVTYDYGPAGGLNDRISRLDALQGTSIAFEQYQYLGLSTVVEREHPQPGVDQTYFQPGATGEAGDQYYGLDRFGRVADQRWRKTSDNSDVDRYQYTYDRDSNRTARTNFVNSTFSETYSYDNLNQLTGFNTTGTATSWDYDAAGNWDGVTTNGTTQSRTHNKQNEIGSATGQTTPTYDADGNQTTDFGNLHYTYDAWGRVRTAGSRTYEYDGLGRRIQRTVSGTATAYFYDDQWRDVEDRVNGLAVDQYVWSPVYVDALVLRDRDTTGDGVVDERLYVAQDANWNVTAIFGISGGVQERYTYDPYGERAIYGPNWGVRNASSWAWVYNFQGLRLDTVTDKYYARERDYDPVEGRWMRLDPLGFGAADANFYRAFANSAPQNRDPLGLDVCYTSIEVIDDGDNPLSKSPGLPDPKAVAKLGPKLTPLGSVAFGFEVIVKADVSGGDDITAGTVQQYVTGATVTKAHDGRVQLNLNVGGINVSAAENDVIAYANDYESFVASVWGDRDSLNPGGADRFRKNFGVDGPYHTGPGGLFTKGANRFGVLATNDTLMWMDFPGFNLDNGHPLAPASFTDYGQLTAFRITATDKVGAGKQAKTLTAEFTLSWWAHSDGTKWTFEMGPTTSPKLPKTWKDPSKK